MLADVPSACADRLAAEVKFHPAAGVCERGGLCSVPGESSVAAPQTWSL